MQNWTPEQITHLAEVIATTLGILAGVVTAILAVKKSVPQDTVHRIIDSKIGPLPTTTTDVTTTDTGSEIVTKTSNGNGNKNTKPFP